MAVIIGGQKMSLIIAQHTRTLFQLTVIIVSCRFCYQRLTFMNTFYEIQKQGSVLGAKSHNLIYGQKFYKIRERYQNRVGLNFNAKYGIMFRNRNTIISVSVQPFLIGRLPSPLFSPDVIIILVFSGCQGFHI